jgi:membrane-associated phospholipid phosphatase
MSKYNRNEPWLKIGCIALILVAGCANSNLEPQISDQADSRVSGGGFNELKNRIITELPKNVVEESKETFLRSDNMMALLLAGGASIAMHNTDADNNLARNFERHQVIDGFASEALKAIGCPGTHFAVTGLWYGLSSQDHDLLNTERAWTMMTALSVNALVTLGLKGIVNNDTPNGKSWAWPSGHTSSSFTVASVLDEFYGPQVGIPAYALASLVGYRMMDEGDHWGSDVIFGAALGWVVGHTIAGRHKNLELGGFTVLPYATSIEGLATGVTLIKRF